MASFNKKYQKYKQKYIELKNTGYEFLNFNSEEDQINFIEENKNIIINMLINCFPANFPDSDKKNYNKYYEIIYNILENSKTSKWFFAIYSNQIVGFCNIQEYLEFIYSENKLETYKIINKFEPEKKIKLGPVIGNLCKNPEFKNIGDFLLNKISDFLKGYFKIIYLIPESVIYKKSYESIISESCKLIDPKLYYESNIKLIKYYIKNSFGILKKIYFMENCGENKILVFHVMAKNLSRVTPKV